MTQASPRACVNCQAELPAGAEVCPACGEEQPVRWMVYLAYALLALFGVGLIYRLFVP